MLLLSWNPQIAGLPEAGGIPTHTLLGPMSCLQGRSPAWLFAGAACVALRAGLAKLQSGLNKQLPQAVQGLLLKHNGGVRIAEYLTLSADVSWPALVAARSRTRLAPSPCPLPAAHARLVYTGVYFPTCAVTCSVTCLMTCLMTCWWRLPARYSTGDHCGHRRAPQQRGVGRPLRALRP